MSTSFNKTATTPSGVACLRQQAGILRHAAHPDIVEIDAQYFDAAQGELQLVKVEGRTLGQLAPSLTPGELVSIFSVLGATVAYLHQQDVAHTHLTSENVIISKASGRPILCGFDRAVMLRQTTSATSGDAADDLRANDVVGLGHMLRSALEPSAAITIRHRLAAERSSDRSYHRDGPNNKRDADLRRGLHALAQRATDAKPNGFSARALAEEIRLLPAVRTPRLEHHNVFRRRLRHSHLRRGRHRRPLPRQTLVKVAGIAIVLGCLSMALVRFEAPPQGQAFAAASTFAPNCPTRPTTALVSDIDADGCADSIAFIEGAVIVDGERYEVGQAGDRFALGHWTCSRTRTIALLRPSNGNVYEFASWPSSGQVAVPRLVGSVTNAQSIAPALGDRDCDLIAITTRDSRSVIIDPTKGN